MIGLNNKKSIKKYVLIVILVLALSVIGFNMYKYHVEGEKNLPFKITKLVVVSSAGTQELEKNDNLYQANVIQNNDVFIGIEKNNNYKKQDAIKKITLNNFNIIESGNIGKLKIYRTSMEDKNFIYSDNYEIKNNLEFFGDLNTNLKMEKMTISNQGGLLEFSLILNYIGKITYEENENITSDGTLLKRLNITEEDIKTVISFDMIIEVSSGNTFKTTVNLELPVGNIVEEGVCTQEKSDLDKLVVKRVHKNNYNPLLKFK